MNSEIQKLMSMENDMKRKILYRKLALKYHPNKGGSDENFKKIQNAYEHKPVEITRYTPNGQKIDSVKAIFKPRETVDEFYKRLRPNVSFKNTYIKNRKFVQSNKRFREGNANIIGYFPVRSNANNATILRLVKNVGGRMVLSTKDRGYLILI
jgi:hypothetical protein